VGAETAGQRARRERQRGLFDGIAGLYDATRASYPAEIVDAMLTTARVGRGAAVLEIGCGTGQLTRRLAGRGLNLTAIDIGAAMADAARRNVADPLVRFQATAFEDLASAGPFDLIVSATAFHWVDPDVGLAKAAQLLRPAGWLALLTTGERYPEPLKTALRELWMRYSRQATEWTDQPAWVTALRESALFGEMVQSSHQADVRLPADTVVGLERTRATFLSSSAADRVGFTASMRALVDTGSHVDLVQETFLAMAPVRERHHEVGASVPDHDRDGDLVQAESPRPGEREVVVEPAVHADANRLPEAGGHVLCELAGQHGPVHVGRQRLQRGSDVRGLDVPPELARPDQAGTQFVFACDRGREFDDVLLAHARHPVQAGRVTGGCTRDRQHGRGRFELGSASQGMRAAAGPASYQAALGADRGQQSGGVSSDVRDAAARLAG